MDALLVLSTLTGSFLLTFLLIPKILNVAHHHQLMDTPNNRSSHLKSVPRLGGVAFYITLIIAMYFMQRADRFDFAQSLIPCLTILFIVGLKDDLVVLSAQSKFISHLVVATFLIFDPSLNVTNLHGFLDIYQIHPVFGSLLVYLIVVGIINAINLTDGIDGLAAGLSLSAVIGFSVLFYAVNREFSFLLCMSLIGILIAFLRYNFSRKRKIFMGDTGAMIIGFMLAFFTVRILTINQLDLQALQMPLSNLPFLLVFFLFIPIFDTLRVMLTRIIRGFHPFSPDRTHLHHFFIDEYNWSHGKISSVLTLTSLGITGLGYLLCIQLNCVGLITSIITFFIGYCTFFILFQQKKSKLQKPATK